MIFAMHACPDHVQFSSLKGRSHRTKGSFALYARIRAYPPVHAHVSLQETGDELMNVEMELVSNLINMLPRWQRTL